MNTWNGIGRLTKDVDLRYSPTGTAIAMFTLAVNRKFKNKNGEYEADFIRCKAFKKPAEILAQYTSKGSQIGVEGTIQTGSYDGQDGKKVFTTDVIVNSFDFLDSKKSGNQQSQQEQAPQQAPPQQTQQPNLQSEGAVINDDDLPF